MSERTYPINTDEIEWTDPTVSGYYPAGVKEKILWENPETGAVIALIKYPAGSIAIAHTHPKANESSYYLDGELIYQGNPMPVKGWFGVNPKGVEHGGGTNFTKDTIVLLSWDGPR